MSILVGAASSSCGSASFAIARGSVLAGGMGARICPTKNMIWK
jgi:hypothetical protein